MASSVIVFGPTGQVGSVAARTAAECGVKVWLAMRDTNKRIPGFPFDIEKTGDYERIHADLQQPSTVSNAVRTSGAKRAFLYLVHGASDHLQGAIKAMKESGVEFVVFLSSFTILTNHGLRDIPSTDLLPHVHAQVEANLEDEFGAEHYVAVRPGCFITNLLSEKRGIIENHVDLYGSTFQQDNIVPSDIGRVVGNILVTGPLKEQHKVYVYGPEILSIHESIAKIGRTLGKDLAITTLGPKEGYDKYISAGMPPMYAKYMVEVHGTKGIDKGNGEIFPNYEEGVNNVLLYTGKPATRLENWVQENKGLFVE